MKGLALILLTISHLATVTLAARRIDAHVRARETMQRRRDVNLLERREVAKQLDTTTLFKLSKGETLSEVRKANNVLGTKVEKLLESYKGVPVYDGIITVRANENGELTGYASGTLIQDIDKDLPDLNAVLTDEQTLELAIDSEGDDMYRFNIGDVDFKRWIYIDNVDNDRARLVNTVSYLIDSVKRPFYIVDLKNGEIIQHWDGLNTVTCDNGARKYKAVGGNEKMGMIKYGKCPYCLNLLYSEDGETCILENEYVKVVDMEGKWFGNMTEPISFPCSTGYNDSINGGYSPATDAFFHGTVTAKIYEEWFDTTPLNDKILLRVHVGSMFGGAYWTGHSGNFGDGDDEHYPLVTLDVVSHEIAHGVSEQACALMYFDEAGAVNEAFSDIMAQAAEEYLLSTDFLVGQYVMKLKPYRREFESPANDNKSIAHASNMNYTIDPHQSSGVFRRAFYIITKEEGVAIRDAAHVFLYANRMYWHHFPSFYDSACGVIMSAIDLGIDTGPFTKAFKDVGVEPCDIETHIYHLTHNKTQSNVTVSDTIHPIFKFELVDFVENVTIRAFNGTTGIDIAVYVYKVNTTMKDELASGNGVVVVEDLVSTSYTLYIKLFTDDLCVYKHVNVMARAACATSYVTEDKLKKLMHFRYCVYGHL